MASVQKDVDTYLSFEEVIAGGGRTMIGYYLMSSYLYYQLDRNVFSDSQFDLLCKELLKVFKGSTHKYKELVSESDLEAGTGYSISLTSYPLGLRRVAERWWRCTQGS